MTDKSKQKGYVIITGAAGGIGRELVKTFQQADYQVIAVDQASLPNNLRVSHYLQVDLAKTVRDEAYAENIFAEIRLYLNNNKLQGLVNNAAEQILAETDKLSRNDWQATLEVNLLAPFFWAQALLPELELAQGCVVNISSIHARLTKKKFVAYATSKAALSGMTKAMAVDLGGRVRVNAIEPAAIETDMLKAGFEGNEAGFAQLKQFHPTLSIGQPEEVGKLAVVLVEGGMQFMNGALVALDGGIGGRLYDPD